MIRYLIMAILLLSCAQKPAAERLFPHGIYQHQVTLDVKGSKHNFSGINKWSKEELTLIALGAFDVTLIRYTDDLIKNKQEIYVDKNFLPISDDKAKSYLGYMKDFYSLDRSICSGKVCQKSFFGMELLFNLNAANQVEHIKFKRGDLKVNIQVVGFEKLP